MLNHVIHVAHLLCVWFCSDIFAHIERNASGVTFQVKCSYLEVYREAIKDLLNPAQNNLPVREHPTRGIYVDGLTEVSAQSSEEVMDVINLGDSARAVASTQMNAVSSRSHRSVIERAFTGPFCGAFRRVFWLICRLNCV